MSYRPIEDYGLIGDGHGCALISSLASIDWLVFERFDSSPLLWSILDDEVGSSISIQVPAHFNWKRNYRSGSNILETTAFDSESEIKITDFMPVGRQEKSSAHDYTKLLALHAVVRKMEVRGQEVAVTFTKKLNQWPEAKKKMVFLEGSERLSFREEDQFTITLKEGAVYYQVIAENLIQPLSIRKLWEMENVTQAFWSEWITYSQYRGDFKQIIERSALTLKMLIHAPSGAIMAAPTTSLPEKIHGSRNWDYRYSWIRDSVFTLYALGYLGYSGEADAYAGFIRKIINNAPHQQLKILYSVDGTSDIPEKNLTTLKGYQESQPVRVGNAAHDQIQFDTHGEFIDWVYLHQALGGEIDPLLLQKVEETADFIVLNWRKKDSGIWEVRSAPEDFTYSKIMCWVTLDRAGSLLGDLEKYAGSKKEIENYIQENCREDRRLKRSAQDSSLDASLLLVKAVGFPITDEVFKNTVKAIGETLGNGPFIKRYHSHDGMKEDEGEFLICSFWMVNAYLFMGELSKAENLFHEITSKLNDLNLMSEEIDSSTGAFLGNYPQALTHLALIETASYFELYEKGGKDALKGCHGDRVRKMHKTLHGPKAVWDFVVKTKNFSKIFPSQQSIYPSFT